MELINRKLIKWIFIIMVVFTVIVELADVFSNNSTSDNSSNYASVNMK